ncbi:hypothetical protein GE061_008559 [Apolygus lucorum]|uniref:Uncharacterized protein n=1 Tax=Apolygus lucorum TaxID=248454 RepID=A0A8S9WMR8_APOLU|nr:hypothetical protein GE061_008559 [Apolygus lucorum]
MLGLLKLDRSSSGSWGASLAYQSSRLGSHLSLLGQEADDETSNVRIQGQDSDVTYSAFTQRAGIGHSTFADPSADSTSDSSAAITKALSRVHAHFSSWLDYFILVRFSVNMAALRLGLCQISLLFLISYISSTFAGVPVLLWESSNVSDKEDFIPALNQLDGDEFSNHLIKKVHTHKPLIVVFVEETLSVEDFSWKDDKRQGAFQKLENITGMAAKMEFIPSVIDPVASLKDLVHSQGYTYTKFDKVNPRNKPGTAVEVALSDPFITEDRPHLLRRHDADITRIYSDLLASAPHIVAIFTGRQNSWVEAEANRVRREANETEQPSVEWKTTGAMVSASSLKLTVDTKTYDLTATDLTDVKIDDRKNYSRIIATYSKSEGANKVKITIRLKFNYDKTSWYIGDSEVDVDATKYQISPKTKTPTSLGQSLSQEDFTLEDTEHKLTLLFKSFQAENVFSLELSGWDYWSRGLS